MNNLYNKLKEEFDTDGDYLCPVKVTIQMENRDIDAIASDVNIPYTIDMEVRDWGIKSLSPLLVQQISVPYQETLMKENGEDEVTDKTLSVDLSESEIEYVSGSIFAPSELIISVAEGGAVVNSRVVFQYINKDHVRE